MKHDEDIFGGKLKSSDFFWIAPIVIMIIGLFPMQIGYYTLSRIIVFICSLYFCLKIYNRNKDITSNQELWFFGIITIIYNPIFPIYLYEKLIWVMVNIVTGYIFYKYKNLIKDN